jgi:hypothetical protein
VAGPWLHLEKQAHHVALARVAQVRGTTGTATPIKPDRALSLSGILCAGHSMTNRSMYAYQQEDDEGGHGRSGGDAVDPQGAH